MSKERGIDCWRPALIINIINIIEISEPLTKMAPRFYPS